MVEAGDEGGLIDWGKIEIGLHVCKRKVINGKNSNHTIE